MTFDPLEWDWRGAPVATHADCPICGADGFMHITIVIKGQVGRNCGNCNRNFPIDWTPIVEPERGES